MSGTTDITQDLTKRTSPVLKDELVLVNSVTKAVQVLEVDTLRNLLAAFFTGAIIPQNIEAGVILGTPAEVQIYYAPAGSYTTPVGVVELTGNLNMWFWNKVAWSYMEVPVAVDLTPLENSVVNLEENKIAVTSIVDNLDSSDTNKVLSAGQGKALKDTLDTSVAAINLAKISKSSIANDLNTSDPEKVLSAVQGKIIKGFVDTAKKTVSIGISAYATSGTNTTSATTKFLIETPVPARSILKGLPLFWTSAAGVLYLRRFRYSSDGLKLEYQDDGVNQITIPVAAGKNTLTVNSAVVFNAGDIIGLYCTQPIVRANVGSRLIYLNSDAQGADIQSDFTIGAAVPSGLFLQIQFEFESIDLVGKADVQNDILGSNPNSLLPLAQGQGVVLSKIPVNRNLFKPFKDSVQVRFKASSGGYRNANYQDLTGFTLSGGSGGTTSHQFRAYNLDSHIVGSYNVFVDIISVGVGKSIKVDSYDLAGNLVTASGDMSLPSDFTGKLKVYTGNAPVGIHQFIITATQLNVSGSLKLIDLYVGKTDFTSSVYIESATWFKTITNHILQTPTLIEGTYANDGKGNFTLGYGSNVRFTYANGPIREAKRLYVSFLMKQVDKGNLFLRFYGWDGAAVLNSIYTENYLVSGEEWLLCKAEYVPSASLTNTSNTIRLDAMGTLGSGMAYGRNLIISDKPITDDVIAISENTSSGSETYRAQVASAALAYATYLPVASETPDKMFTFLHGSDVHYDDPFADANLAELIEFSNLSPISSKISAIVLTGDYCTAKMGTAKATTLSQLTRFVARAITSVKPVYPLKGNHDDGGSYASGNNSVNGFANMLSYEEQFNTFIKPFNDKYGHMVLVNNKCYYHSDIVAKKVRVIALDFADIPIVNDGAGGVKYIALKPLYYSQAQLDWLFDTLKSTPVDYGLTVLNHGPFTNALGTYIQGSLLIPDIIEAWKMGNSYTHNYTNATYPELNTSKVFDFAGDGTREFIMYGSGHWHGLYFQEPIAGQNMVSVPNMPMEESGSLARANTNELRNSFACTTINRDAKKIAVTMFGAFRDPFGDVKDQTTILNY